MNKKSFKKIQKWSFAIGLCLLPILGIYDILNNGSAIGLRFLDYVLIFVGGGLGSFFIWALVKEEPEKNLKRKRI